MSPAEIRSAREAFGMTIATFAFWLGLEGENGRRKIRRFESGEEALTGPAARALKLALALKGLLDADPDEPEWRQAADAAERALGAGEAALGHSIGSRSPR